MAGVGRKPNASLPSGPDADDRAYAAMIARARGSDSALARSRARTEELRRLPPETERDLHESGLFRIVQPKRVGGSELDYVALVDCADAIGQADASVAWNFANLASHHWMLAHVRQACSGSGLGQGRQRPDRILLHFSGRPRQESRWRICVARQLAVLVGGGFLRMEYAGQRCFLRR